MKKVIIFLTIVFCSILNAQVLLTNYFEADSELRMKLKLNATELLPRNEMKGFFDESKNGYFALPSKSIIIGIPFSEKYSITSKVLNEEKKRFVLGVNPEVVKNNNEELQYNFISQKIYKGKPKPTIEVKGYFWLGEIYCVNLEINQYSYDDKTSIISQINEIEIKIEFKGSKNLSKFAYTQSIHNLNSLINAKYAIKYSGKPNKILIGNDTTNNWIDYTKQYLKIGTLVDGIYRLTKDHLEQNGLIVQSINPKTFKLFSKGKEIPIFVEGENDLSFDSDDYIEFVGLRNLGGNHRIVSKYDEPYNEYLGRYTDTTIYWLTWDGVAGKRVNVFGDSEVTNADTLKSYTQIDHYETNIWFDFATVDQVRRESPFWSENKTWNEGNLNIGIRNKNFVVSDIYPNKPFHIYVKLQDFASDISKNAHLLSLGLNSYERWSDSIYIDKYEQIVLDAEFNSNLLNSGNNTLKINSIATESSINLCVFDWFEIEYERYLKPIDNFLNFSFSFLKNKVAYIVMLQNISADNFTIWKYGDSYKKFTLKNIENAIVFSDTISSSDKYAYSNITKILTPKIYYKKQFINLRRPDNKSDYLAITHKKFLTKVIEYSEFISNSYNLCTSVIDIDDIYDEFSYGLFNPEAIKSFLQSTHNYWQNPKPKYVVLIGGATYDYYGNKFKNLSSVKERVINYVPSFGAPVSDNWFVTWDTTGTYIPQMNIGRIPVTNNDELEWYFDKHKTFVEQGFDDWNKRYIFFSSGDAKNISELSQLKESNQFVIDNFINTRPIGGTSTHFYKTVEPKTNFGPYSEEFFQSVIDKGAMFISYLGHSGTQIWDNTIVSPLQLKNTRNRYPIVSDFGCSTGKFGEPDIKSFSELFTVNQDGQALAYIGNTSLGFLSTAINAPKIFYKKILRDSVYNVSEALNRSKLEMLQDFGSTGVYKLFALTNTLIGDPIISLSVPQKPNFVIEEKDVEINTQFLNDLQDNVGIKIKYHNYGSAINDSIHIQIESEFNNIKNINSFKVDIPNFEDSIQLNIPIKNKAGSHSIKVKLDEYDAFDEISESDNILNFTFNVGSSLIRPIIEYQYVNGIDKKITFINPTSKPKEEIIIFDISNNLSFISFSSHEIHFDSLFTIYSFENIEKNKRYFGRTKIKGGNNFSASFSFLNSSPKYLLADSVSFSSSISNNLHFHNNSNLLDSSYVTFELFSAGFDDGQAAIISRNGVNYVPTPLVGHHIALFNSLPPYEFIEYKYFNTLEGGINTSNYIHFLDTLTNDYLVAIAISDEGSPRSDELKAQIKSLGSQFIDQVGWRSSWAFIGKKGAIIGSMPEAISKSGDGPVTIDSTLSYITDNGKLITNIIGPSTNWENLVVQDSLPNNSQIIYKPILISQVDNSEDTLDALNIVNGEASLSFIDAKKYPYIKFLAEFKAGDNNTSPVLKSLGVDYDGIPELAINYQVVSVENDTIQQGENANLQFYVYNVGESKADSVKVIVEVVNSDNSKEKIFEQIIDSLGSEKRQKFNLSYNTSNFNGAKTFSISIDPENKITELYEDNNYFNIPFTVIGDTTKPTLALSFDGNEIFDGEYISSNPNIKIELNDPSLVPISDTTSIAVFLNNKYVSYFSNPEILKINYSSSNPKVTVEYNPKLEDGEYILKVLGKDASGNSDQNSGITKSFNVLSEPKLLEVYNYPNPFNNDTYFTFKLTQIPDEIKIRVFTVAGRLIKEINLSGNQLNYDMNKIYWDGKDEDGDPIGNGVYLYKVIMDVNGEKQDITQKLAVVR
ncbi:MAG: T9SS type A sorting domain-containing protein [Ignavibacteriae bacterium]|nr:T9SS type A sorting domain-containing protein [Ignavibacteriota bacterium]